jgi:Fic family protein
VRGRLVRRTWEHDPALYAPARYRRACAYQAFLPDPLVGFAGALSGEVAGVVSDAEAAVHALNARARPTLAPLARLLLRTESIASSKVEGMQIDSRDLARAEVRLDSGGKAGPSATEILANIDAMELAVYEAASADAVRVQQIAEIHAALMAGAPNSHIAGQFRVEQNWIGGNNYNPCGADFVPPPPEAVSTLLSDLCSFVDEQRLPPLVQAGLIHAQFETIHPFMDGNGRTGRALVHVVLRRRGLAPAYVPPISVVLAAGRGHYIQGLTAFREGDVDGWLLLFAAATARAAGLAKDYLEAVHRLQERWRDQIRAHGNPRADAAAWRLIDVLPAHPVITLPVAVTAVERSKAVVNQALADLEEAEVLIRLGDGRRNRSWEASGLLDLLSHLDQAASPPSS